MSSVFDYIFNISGNYTATINGMSNATGEFSAQVEGAQSKLGKFTTLLAGVDLVKNALDGLNQATEAMSSSGIKLDSQMHDLSAVAGVTGDGLKQIERFARESAKAFGTDASVAVEGYKLLLSQLSPELGKYPEALRSMGDCIQTTSKLMGGDGVAAAQVLTTAMNQYGVSMEDPMAASAEMARMMNVMAAAGQAGSAELPAISAALQQCGMAAKAANVSFEETNAAIQVLDKAGKKASEGGVALRNVLGQLSKGRFVEKQAAEELQKAGIDVTALGDNSKSLKERLEMLKPMLNDSALLSKFFGVENANAARALIQGTDALAGFTEAVTGTNSATDQASIVMDSYAERQARVNQKIDFLGRTLNRNEHAPFYPEIRPLISNNYVMEVTKMNIGDVCSSVDFGIGERNASRRSYGNQFNGDNTVSPNYINGLMCEISSVDNRNPNKRQIEEFSTNYKFEHDASQIKYNLTVEDIEDVVIEMFRKESELCLY